MKSLKTKLATKLKNSAGESIAEVLIALLIAALALTMLASVISTSSRIITTTKEKMKTYYEENDKLSAQGTTTNTLGLTIEVKSWKFKAPDATVFTNHTHPSVPASTSTYNTHLINGDTSVLYYMNDKLGGTKVVSFKKN